MEQQIKKEVKVKQEPKVAVPAVVKSEPGIVYTSDLTSLTAESFQGGRVQETVPLCRGPNGFLVAKFSTGDWSSDLPNLVLGTAPAAAKPKAKKGKAAAAASAKPTAEDASQVAAAASAEPPPEDASQKSYGLMFYKNSHSIGVRAKFGKKNQVFSFGGTSAKAKSKEQMLAIGDKVLDMLKNGLSYEEAKIEGQKLSVA